jgi:hypothetical protein
MQIKSGRWSGRRDLHKRVYPSAVCDGGLKLRGGVVRKDIDNTEVDEEYRGLVRQHSTIPKAKRPDYDLSPPHTCRNK